MDEHDLSNVEFILSLSESDLRDWWKTLTEDDRKYSESILKEFNSVLDRATQETNRLFKDLNI